MHNRWL